MLIISISDKYFSNIVSIYCFSIFKILNFILETLFIFLSYKILNI